MGLSVDSLASLDINHNRKCFIFLLKAPFRDEISEYLESIFIKLGARSSRLNNTTIVISPEETFSHDVLLHYQDHCDWTKLPLVLISDGNPNIIETRRHLAIHLGNLSTVRLSFLFMKIFDAMEVYDESINPDLIEYLREYIKEERIKNINDMLYFE